MAITEYNSEEEMEDAFEAEMERMEDISRKEEYIASLYDDLEYAKERVNELKSEIQEEENELVELQNSSEL